MVLNDVIENKFLWVMPVALRRVREEIGLVKSYCFK